MIRISFPDHNRPKQIIIIIIIIIIDINIIITINIWISKIILEFVNE